MRISTRCLLSGSVKPNYAKTSRTQNKKKKIRCMDSHQANEKSWVINWIRSNSLRESLPCEFQNLMSCSLSLTLLLGNNQIETMANTKSKITTPNTAIRKKIKHKNTRCLSIYLQFGV